MIRSTNRIGRFPGISKKLTNPNIFSYGNSLEYDTPFESSPCTSVPLGSTGNEDQNGIGIISNWRTAESIQVATGLRPNIIVQKNKIISIQAYCTVKVQAGVSDGFFNMRGCRVFTNAVDSDSGRAVASVGGSSSNTSVPAGTTRSKTVSFNWTSADITLNAIKYLGFWVSGGNVGLVSSAASVFIEFEA